MAESFDLGVGQLAGFPGAARRAGDPAQLIADNAAVRTVLDWRPRYDDLDFIVETAIDWERALSKSNAGSSKLILFGVWPCWLRSDAMARTVAQIAFDTDATRRESVFALLPRSTSSAMYPRRITTAAKFRLSLLISQSFKSPSFFGSMPASCLISSGLSSLRQPPLDSGGGK